MKKVKIFNTTNEFEAFVNSEQIDVIKLDIKIVQQSYFYQEGFIAVVFYKIISKKII